MPATLRRRVPLPPARPRRSREADAWRALLAAWDVAPGSASERALARAVLADAAWRPRALVRRARRVLARG